MAAISHLAFGTVIYVRNVPSTREDLARRQRKSDHVTKVSALMFTKQPEISDYHVRYCRVKMIFRTGMVLSYSIKLKDIFMMKWRKGRFWITDDPAVVDVDFVTTSLNTTYWAQERPRAVIEKSLRNSVVLSLFKDKTQIGLTRIVGDKATFAWICDVYVAPEHRKQGLGKWLVQCALEHPICDVRLHLLATKDAHGLYQKFGFTHKECMALYRDS
jgi:GNAT superfamily N-acetyltransferase